MGYIEHKPILLSDGHMFLSLNSGQIVKKKNSNLFKKKKAWRGLIVGNMVFHIEYKCF